MNYREQAHELIGCLPESQVSALVGLLESIVDPVTAALRSAPLDDEEENEEERAAVAETRRSLERNGGKGISHSEAMRRLGLEQSVKQIEWSEESLQDLAAIDKGTARRVKAAVERFAETGAGNVKKLQDIDPPQFRLRVGDFRVRFDTQGDTLRILRVRNRKDAHR